MCCKLILVYLKIIVLKGYFQNLKGLPQLSLVNKLMGICFEHSSKQEGSVLSNVQNKFVLISSTPSAPLQVYKPRTASFSFVKRGGDLFM